MLYIFIEGFDDERFLSEIFANIFGEHKFIQYSGWSDMKINNFIRSIGCTPMSDYIFFADADGRCIEEKIQALIEKYISLTIEKVSIVQYEIESWYYSGVSQDISQKLRLKQYIYNTNALTKEQFNAKLPRKADRKYIMTQILALYELNLAKERNLSLSLFIDRIKKEPA